MAHVTGSQSVIAAPNVCLIGHDDIVNYTIGAVQALRNRRAGSAAQVWTNATTGALRAALPQ